MSQIGYYRYKIDNLPEGVTEISFYKNGNLAVTHTVDIKGWCTERKILKYIDKNGQYRFYPFNARWESKDKPKLLGKANKFITSILTDQTNEKNIGYKNERKISLVADNVSNSELESLQDIWLSPRVYLFIGELNDDNEKDWIEVIVSSKDTISKRRKLTNGKMNIDIILPEWFTITML